MLAMVNGCDATSKSKNTLGETNMATGKGGLRCCTIWSTEVARLAIFELQRVTPDPPCGLIQHHVLYGVGHHVLKRVGVRNLEREASRTARFQPCKSKTPNQ